MALILGLYGLITGSFLNVLILRHGARSLGGRSECMSCGKQIGWYDNVPVFSWIFLRGRCRNCKARISAQYPLVEASCGLLFAMIGLAPISLLFQILALPVAALLLAIAVYDLKHTIIPDSWVVASGAFAFLFSYAHLAVFSDMRAILLLLIAGPTVALPLFLFWLLSGGRWMGLGDAKLALVFGWLLGISGGLGAIFFSFIVGGAVSAPLLLLSSQAWQRFSRRITPTHRSRAGRFSFTMKSEIPFGPFLIASCFVVWFAQLYGISLFFPWQLQ